MIYGERIRLRMAERSDIPRFLSWFNDPEVTRYLSMYLPMSADREEAWFENMLKSSPEEHVLVIEVLEGESWKPIGNCGLFNIDHKNRSAEVGICIGEKSYWNKGYGTEVMRVLLKHGFQTLNLHRMYLRVFAENLGGIRAYEKAGYIHEGCMRSAEYREGRYLDVLFMSVLKSDWEPS